MCDIYVIDHDILHVFACCAYESQTQYTCACMVACCNHVVGMLTALNSFLLEVAFPLLVPASMQTSNASYI